MKLIDSDIVIDHFHGHKHALDYFAEHLATGEVLAISVITVTELLGGMRPGEQERNETLLRLFKIVEINEDIARRAGGYLNQFRRSHNLELGDALIAASAAHIGADLITRNLRHYPMTDINVIAPYARGKS